jgi:tetratricopeptide (TPR) repeat protein
MLKICALFFSCVFIFSSPASAQNPQALEKLQDQQRQQSIDLAVLEKNTASKLDAQDKRIADLGLTTAQQSNYMAAVANQTTQIGNYIAWTSAALAFVGLIAGLFAYRGAVSRAKLEAKQAAEEWFNEKAQGLALEIIQLKKKASSAAAQIDAHQADVESASQDAVKEIAEKLSKAANQLMANTALDGIGSTKQPANESALITIREASKALREKPESQFTSDDFYTRGVEAFSLNKYAIALDWFEKSIANIVGLPSTAQASYFLAQGAALGHLQRFAEAIAVFAEIEERFGKDDNPAVRPHLAAAMYNKGVVLNRLQRLNDAITIFDQVDELFSEDENHNVRETVASALNGKGFNLLLLSKLHWKEYDIRATQLADACTALSQASTKCGAADKAMVLGNLGYAHWLLNQLDLAKKYTEECLQLGGVTSLDAQRKDALMNRVEPEDTAYETMLAEVWAKIQSNRPPSTPT